MCVLNFFLGKQLIKWKICTGGHPEESQGLLPGWRKLSSLPMGEGKQQPVALHSVSDGVTDADSAGEPCAMMWLGTQLSLKGCVDLSLSLSSRRELSCMVTKPQPLQAQRGWDYHVAPILTQQELPSPRVKGSWLARLPPTRPDLRNQHSQ